MRLRIEHTTRFEYADPISESYSELRLKPADGAGQRCLSFGLGTDPADGTASHYIDRFGNDVRFLDVLRPHQALAVRATSEVLTASEPLEPLQALSPLDAFDFLLPTALTAPVALAEPAPGLAPRERALEIMRAVHAALVYTKGATEVSTAAPEALALGRGVCQDYSHVMLSACRSAGIAARYVSGYLFTRGMEGSNFDDAATHAWVDVWLPDIGWWALDPTHNIPQGERHVRLGIGRDYADVPPTRGVFKGNTKETLVVKVEIRQVG